MRAIFSAFMFVGLLAACATTPRPIVEGPISPLTPEAARANQGVGPNERVRWGGEILDVMPGENQTCFEILSHELDVSGRPRESRETDGRFIACDKGFYDPAVYSKERELTVVGSLMEPETRKIGEADYLYPRLQIEKLYLWPQYSQFQRYPYYDPFWGFPYSGFGYGFGYRPFLFRGRGHYW